MQSSLFNRTLFNQRSAAALLILGASGTALGGDIIPIPLPDLDVEVALSQVSANAEFDLVATVTNNGSGTASSPSVQLGFPVGFSVQGGNTKNATSIPAGESIEVEFRVSSPCDTGIFSVNATARNGNAVHDTDQTFFFSTIEELNDNDVLESDAAEKSYSIEYTAGDWWVAAVDPGSANQNITIRESACGPVRAGSYYGGFTTDFVLVNGNVLGSGEAVVQVLDGEWGNDFDVELDRAYDTGVGEVEDQLTGPDLIDLFEFPSTVGVRYRVTADPDALLDITLAIADAGRNYASRSSANERSSSGGNGDAESVEFYGHNGRTAIVIAQDSPVSGTYDLTITPICFCDLVDEGTINILDLLTYLDLWFADDLDADTNSNNDISIVDLLEFLDCWLTASQFGCF